MTDQTLITQAALIYPVAPQLPLASIFEELNELDIWPEMTASPMSSPQFALFANADLHASVAIHRNRLGGPGFDRALNSEVTKAKPDDFDRILDLSQAHVVISVGDGPTPAAFDKPKPVPVSTRAALLFELIRIVMSQVRPQAAHLCTSDMFYSTEELDKALLQPLPPILMIHPVPAVSRANGTRSNAMIAQQAQYLIGRTLVIDAVPDPVPTEMSVVLIDTLIRQHMSGALPLKDGDALAEALGMSLLIRRVPPDADFPAGRIVASFADETEESKMSETAVDFRPHPGYGAVATARPEPERQGDIPDWTPPEGASVRGSSSSTESSKGIPTWMILVGVGLFLWVVVPLLDIPRLAIQAAFSNDLNRNIADR